jgi:DNA-binding LacI/PurR family transcriptional regulator
LHLLDGIGDTCHVHDSPVRRVTIRDVATAAGVSISTVSHVFSRARPISEGTANRVRAAAETLGYVPNPSAASLRGGQVGLLGLVLRPRNAVQGSLGGTETFTRFSGAAAAATLATGRGLLHVPDPLGKNARRFVMDGCIVMGPYRNDEVIAGLRKRRVPVVAADIDPDLPADPWSVRVEYAPGIRAILDKMWSEGARRFGLILGNEANHWTLESNDVVRQWCSDRGVPCEVRRVFEGQGETGAYEIARDLMRADDRPDAVLVGSTRFAIGVLRAAADRGLSVPDDITLAALTESALTRDAVPAVTSLDLLLERQAAMCVELLIDQIDGREPPAAQQSVVAEVKWRHSTGTA